MTHKRNKAVEYLQPLVGGTITDIIDDAPYTALRVECEDGSIRLAWIYRDPEGNGPGWLELVRGDRNAED